MSAKTATLDDILNARDSKDDEREVDYYAVLNCTPLSTVEQIRAEYRALARMHHPDRTGGTRDYQFEQIAVAYRVLESPEERAAYDQWRQSGLRIPYRQWRNLKSGHSMHWKADPSDLVAALLPCSPPSTIAGAPASSAMGQHRQANDDLYARFRNYEI
ncbi:DnaJ sub C member 12 [Spiromyces aspiralis]|uniref:DnaJ sub C member 12 n=1 Tax=Spiromyces aspiralis TaxID=68401 RepID=A0ACC1HND1_9FUNG|nr:DnaJ sub C member 12 [Spiromyces aspiralis]